MKKSIFYFDKLETWDKVLLLSYCFLSSTICFFYLNSSLNETRQNTLHIYIFGSQFCLYALCYKSLRNMTVFVFWLLIGASHFVIYLNLIGDKTLLNHVNNHAATGFRNTIPLLILFQVLRFINIKIQGQELVAPSKSTVDLFENRKINIMDWISFMLYIISLVLLLN